MPIKRDLKLGRFGISKYAYRELHNFCLQYPDKKQKLSEIRSPYRSPEITDLPKAHTPGDPVCSAAVKAACLAGDVELIERCAKQASADDWKHVLLAVTQDVPWYSLRVRHNLQTGEKTFNRERQSFYCYLAQEKNLI